MSYGQEVIRSVNKFQYGKFSGTWFTMVENQKGDLVDTLHIILRLKNRADIKKFDFKSISLPALKDVRGKIAEDFYEVEVPKGNDAFNVLKSLNGTGEFEDVFFNVLVRVDATPNDTNYSGQWNLPKVSVPNAWDLTTGSSSVIVAVVDVGGDYNHEDLSANKWSGTGYDFYGQDSDPYPYDGAGHGTCVAGIIAAETNNSLGVSGIAGGWNGSGGIRVMQMRAGYRYYDSYYQQWLELIDIAAASQATDSAAAWGAKVINMSFGSSGQQPTLESAINRAVNNKSVVVVASAGNYQSGQSTAIVYPAAYSNVIAIGATTENDTRKSINDGTDESWWGSCYGSQLWIMAPGIHVPTTDITGLDGYDSGKYYLRFNGTSAAAPHVSATVALMRSVNPSLTVTQIRTALRYSAYKVSAMGTNDWTSEYGYGRLNSNAAVRNFYVPQMYSTISAALAAAVPGQTIQVTGTQTISSNLTVPSGITLSINSGATITFSAGKKLIVYAGGTLTTNGATFRGNGTPGNWNSISFYSNSSGSIQGSTIKDAQCGIYVTTGANVTVTNSTITNNSIYGFSIISNSNANISGCTISNNNKGISVISANATISSSTISNNGTGIYISSSNVAITGNNILNSTSYGINANNVSSSFYWHNNNLHGNAYAMLLTNASPWIGHCDISDNSHGVVMNSSSASFAVPPSEDNQMLGYNAITCATTPLLKQKILQLFMPDMDIKGDITAYLGVNCLIWKL